MKRDEWIMSDIKKATEAIWHVLNLLQNDRKNSAIRLMELVYQCDTSEASEFVYAVELAYDLGN